MPMQVRTIFDQLAKACSFPLSIPPWDTIADIPERSQAAEDTSSQVILDVAGDIRVSTNRVSIRK